MQNEATAQQLPAETRDWTDTVLTESDWADCGWEPGSGIVPERILVSLPDRPGRPGGEVNALAAFDVDSWAIFSAHWIDGEPVELTDADERFIKGKLEQRAERLRNDW